MRTNKKYYNFTEKQKRNDYNKKIKHSWNSAPKSFIKDFGFEKQFRRHNKMTLKYNLIHNEDIHKDFLYTHRHNAVWIYW